MKKGVTSRFSRPQVLAVQSLRASPDAPQLLEWDCLDDAGLAAYLVEREGVPVGRTLQAGFIDGGLRAGQSTNFSVRAIDRAGNLDPASTLLYQMPASFQRLQNGGFDTDLTGWSLSELNGAVGVLSRQIGGAVHVAVPTPADTDWSLQFQQALDLHTGVRYALSFRARSSVATNISVSLQHRIDPYASYAASGPLALSSTWQSFELAAQTAANQPSNVSFMLAVVPMGAWVEIDDVRLIERAP